MILSSHEIKCKIVNEKQILQNVTLIGENSQYSFTQDVPIRFINFLLIFKNHRYYECVNEPQKQ